MGQSKVDQPRTAGRFAEKTVKPHFMPVWAYAGIVVAATVLYWISTAAGLLVPLGLVAAAGAVTLLIIRSLAARRKWTKNGRLAAMIAAVVATVWALAWILFVPSWFWAFAGCVLTGLTGIPWWRKHHIANVAANTPEPEPEPAEDEAAPAPAPEPTVDDIIIGKWNTRIAGEGPLKGVGLEHLDTDERGYVHKFIVNFVPGKQTYSTLLAAQAHIASALNVPEPNVITEKNDEDASKGFVTVVTGLDLGRVNRWPGRCMFDPATGTVSAGTYIDDDAATLLSVIVPNGMYGAVFCGAQGTGKSQCMEQVVLSLLASGFFSLLYIDPQGGMSSPMLAEAATWSAPSVEDGIKILRNLPRLRQYRQTKFGRRKQKGYQLSREFPAIIIAIDEFHEVAEEPEAKKILKKLAKTIRKIGAGLFIATQDVGLDAFGGDQSLRTQLMAKNVIYFATPSKVQGHLSGNNEFDPSTLPMVPGFGYVKEVRGDRGELLTRAAPFRAFYLGDDDEYGENSGIHWLKKMRQQCSFAELDLGSAGALGPDFANRNKVRAEQAVADDAFIAACEQAGAGAIDFDELDLLTGAAPQANAAGPSVNGRHDFGIAMGGTAPVAAQGDQLAGLTEAGREVVYAIRSGAATPAAVVRRIATRGGTVSKSRVEQLLNPKIPGNVIEPGFVHKVELGHYHARGFEADCDRCKSEQADPGADGPQARRFAAESDTSETFDAVATAVDAAMDAADASY
ncbi:hypothetical protein [Glycomyces sp. YM15]|uniref:hypothetical protein n=1 Tax=Glycomyces sp. YM15 TaxID=2800446 RepID=UPI001965D8C7|nr:hypothetical protein [Glycomyces sp. YM15]